MLAGAAIAQQPAAVPPPPPDFSKVEIKTTDLGDNVYMLEGQGGNITVAVAKDGIIMVDGQFAPLHDKIKAAIAVISNLPIKYLVNTHFHGDHTGGNEPFAKDGATVVAADQCQDPAGCGHHQRPDRRQDAAGSAGRAAGQDLHRSVKIRLHGPRRRSQHIANAHTDGDTYVWFKTANVLATGDTFTNGRYPNIDFANGGNIKGMIAAADAYLKLDQRQEPDRAGPRPDRRQGGAARIPRHAGHRARPHGTSWSRTARARTTSSRRSRSPISTRNGRRPSLPAPTSSAWSIIRSPTSRRRRSRC